MTRKNSTQGFAVVETVLIIIILIILGFIGWYAWHNTHDANTGQTKAKSSPQTSQKDLYAGWKSYTDPAKTYTVKYPSTWKTFDNGETPTVATDVIGIGPKDNAMMITISSYASSQTPKAFWTADEKTPPVKSEDLTINGNGAYHEETGDSTNTNFAYAIGKDGRIVTVYITEKSTTPPVDNTRYMTQFNLIAKSVELK